MVKVRAGDVFAALRQGSRVYVTRRGRVVACIDPAIDVPETVLAAAAIGALERVISSRSVQRDGIGIPVDDAVAGLPTLVAADGHVVGLLRAATEPPVTYDFDMMADLDEATRREAARPGVTAAELAAFTADWLRTHAPPPAAPVDGGVDERARSELPRRDLVALTRRTRRTLGVPPTGTGRGGMSGWQHVASAHLAAASCDRHVAAEHLLAAITTDEWPAAACWRLGELTSATDIELAASWFALAITP